MINPTVAGACFLVWIIGGVLFHPDLITSARAQHLKSVALGTVLNPMDWDGLYDPGQVVSNALEQYGAQSPGMLWVRSDIQLGKPMTKKEGVEDALLNPPDKGKIPEEKPRLTQFILEGELKRFNPRVAVPNSIPDAEPGKNYAEIQLRCRLVHNLTGRVVADTLVWAVGTDGSAPFPNTPESLVPGHPDFQKTSMGQAVEMLSNKTMTFLEEELSRLPLEAQILNFDEELNQVTLNAGKRNNILIGDEVAVYRVTPHMKDPLTGADLGDHYKKIGVVRVMEVGDGFAEAVVLLGIGFKTGMLARLETNPEFYLLTHRKKEEGLPEHEGSSKPFEGIHRDRQFPRNTITSLDLFDTFGFELDY